MLSLLLPEKNRAAAGDGWSSNSWYGSRVKTQAGVVVSDELALTYAACWCASRVLCEGISMLPLESYERDGTSRRLATEQPAYRLLNGFANSMMDSHSFRDGRTLHQVNNGNGFAEIERDRLLDPVALWPIHPTRVRPARAGDSYDNGQPLRPGAYMVRNNDGGYTAVEKEDMLHVHGVFPEDGVWGKGVLPYARETVGMGIGTERHGATQFGAGNIPRVAVTDTTLKDDAQRKEFRRTWKEIYGSSDSAEIAIITSREGKIEPLQFNNEQSQYLETRGFTKREIGTFYRVPIHMIGGEDSSPQRTVEALGLEFVIFSLMPWAKRWEGQCDLKLFRFRDRGRFYTRHDFRELLRGDVVARFTAYRLAIMIGIMTPNECRELEHMEPGGPECDELFFPANMTTLKNIASGMAPAPTTPGPGSDHSGAPAESDPLLEFDKEQLFIEGAKSLSRIGRDDLVTQLKAIEASMQAAHRGAMAPVPAAGTNGSVPPSAHQKTKKKRRARFAAARGVLLDVVARMARKEAQAAQRAAEGKGDWDAWLTPFFAKHESTLAQALAPAAALLGTIGLEVDAVALAGRLTAWSRRDLTAAYDQLTRERFAELLAVWPTERAEAIADVVMAGGVEFERAASA